MTTSLPNPAEASSRTTEVGLACMEIWGGSERASDAVAAPGVDVRVHSEPFQGNAAGGDIHYVSVCGSGRYVRTAIADVSGHGEHVARLAKTLRDLVRRHINTPDQSRFARALNDEFTGLELEGRFATAILTTWHAPSGSLIVCNAGHPRPLHFNAREGRWSLLDAVQERNDAARSRGLRNLPLGVIDGTSYEQYAVPIEEGDSVLLYTDAMIEARSPDGSMLGEEGLLDLVCTVDAGADHAVLVEATMHAVCEHRGGAPADDDVTLVHLRRNGAAPKYSLSERVVTVAKILGLRSV